jgi:hypothetical protein
LLNFSLDEFTLFASRIASLKGTNGGITINKTKITFKKLFKDHNGPRLMIRGDARGVIARSLFIFFPSIMAMRGVNGNNAALFVLVGAALAISQFAPVWFLQIMGAILLFIFGILAVLWGLFINPNAIVYGGFCILLGLFTVHSIKKYFNKTW